MSDIPFITNLPSPILAPRNDYGSVSKIECLVVHTAEYPVSSGLALANYAGNNPNGYVWNSSIGSYGQEWIHLGLFEQGAHAAGLNDISWGVEQVGYAGQTPFLSYPKQLNAMARAYARQAVVLDKVPSRSWIIGHNEDHKFGGSSTHTDPGSTWPWEAWIDLTVRWYEFLRNGASPVAKDEGILSLGTGII